MIHCDSWFQGSNHEAGMVNIQTAKQDIIAKVTRALLTE